MIFTKELVWQTCKIVAPIETFDPYLIMAICEQECQKDDKGNYDASVGRLEQNFYARYLKRQALATSSEVLLSASYGVMQMMGESLRERGYFDWFKVHEGLSFDADSQLVICQGVDRYCTELNWMIEWGVKHLSEKRRRAGGDIRQTLLGWNGGGDRQYDDEIFERKKRLERELK